MLHQPTKTYGGSNMGRSTSLLLALLMVVPVYAANDLQVPEQLQPWQGWVLHKQG